jgi:PAS domain S-box-containing protein
MPARSGGIVGVIAATTGVAVLLTAAATGAQARAPAGTAQLALLVGVLVLAGVLQVHVRHRDRTTEASDLFWVALAVCAVAFEPAALVVVTALSKLLSQALLRVDPLKAAFNTAMAAASAAAIAATLATVPQASLLLPLALALTAGWAVNHVALVAVLSAAGVRREVVTWQALGRWATHGATTSALGIVLAVAWSADPWTVVLFAVPSLALHAAGRALVSAVGERRRLSAGAAASRVLSGGQQADLAAYCTAVAAAFGSQRACLVVAPGTRPVVVPTGAATAPPWAAAAAARVEDDTAVAVAVPDEGGVTEVLAVRLPGRPGSLLAVADPTGARERLVAELAFLASAAGDLAAYLHAEGLRALADSRLSRLETVVAAVADGIVTVDAGSRVLGVNAAAARITGVDAAALQDRPALSSLGLRRVDGSPWEPDLRSATAVRAHVAPAAGVLRHVDVSVAPAVLDDTPGAVLVLRDVTAAVEREQARLRFLVGLSHELRTPLTPLLGWAQMLQRRPELLDGPVRDTVVDALATQSGRLARLVDNLMTAVDPRAMVTERRTVDLVEAAQLEVEHAAAVLGPRRVHVVGPGPVAVTTSPAALSHIIGNLLTNVGRYVPEQGSAVVLVRAEEGRALLTVLDDGPGVPVESREAVFTLFSHAEGGEANPGAGVGLTTSRRLARALGGDLECVDPATERAGRQLLASPGSRSTGPGAAFRLSLPVVAPDPDEAAADAAGELFS